jgi:hypothetical protein
MPKEGKDEGTKRVSPQPAMATTSPAKFPSNLFTNCIFMIRLVLVLLLENVSCA